MCIPTKFCECSALRFFFFFNDTAPTEIYTLSLHDALPIYHVHPADRHEQQDAQHVQRPGRPARSEEHTSELQLRLHLVCRLLLEKKKNTTKSQNHDQRSTSSAWLRSECD